MHSGERADLLYTLVAFALLAAGPRWLVEADGTP